ncbi:hypothetical protein HBO07_18135 [Pseudomonas proteolytica]|nr:hypothetical protein [Pseudomonas proteolytica]
MGSPLNLNNYGQFLKLPASLGTLISNSPKAVKHRVPSWKDTGSSPSGKGSMAIRFYALSGQVSLVQKVRVWGKMLVLVAATGFGTEMVDACSPAPSAPLNEMSVYAESVDGLGYAGLREVDAPNAFQHGSVLDQDQRWIF